MGKTPVGWVAWGERVERRGIRDPIDPSFVPVMVSWRSELLQCSLEKRFLPVLHWAPQPLNEFCWTPQPKSLGCVHEEGVEMCTKATLSPTAMPPCFSLQGYFT